jgi:hypothetical protein
VQTRKLNSLHPILRNHTSCVPSRVAKSGFWNLSGLEIYVVGEEGNAISPSALAFRRQDDDRFPCGDDRPSRFTMLYFDFLELTFFTKWRLATRRSLSYKDRAVAITGRRQHRERCLDAIPSIL